MAKLAPTSTKYSIKTRIKANGVIEKPDVIGAVFGQTEGLLGSDLDLRELQRTGRIGRIEVKLRSNQGKSEGEIVIPSSLDSAETALIAATLETIDRIGPCTAEIEIITVEDARSMKRKYVIDRAKSILKNLVDKNVPETSSISEQIKEAVRTHEITTYHGLPCGPNIQDYDEIIIVEGRADILNLLKYGVNNVIAIEGTSISNAITDLAKKKTITVFVDGDRGGELIARELLQKTDVDYVATAPEGKEVEELSKKETYKALRNKMTAEQFKMEVKQNIHEKSNHNKPEKKEQPRKKIELKPKDKEQFKKILEELVGTRAACIFNEKKDLLGKVPVTELHNTLKTVESPYAVIFDGKIDYKLNAIARKKDVAFLIGMEKEDIKSPVKILSKDDLK